MKPLRLKGCGWEWEKKGHCAAKIRQQAVQGRSALSF